MAASQLGPPLLASGSPGGGHRNDAGIDSRPSTHAKDGGVLGPAAGARSFGQRPATPPAAAPSAPRAAGGAPPSAPAAPPSALN